MYFKQSDFFSGMDHEFVKDMMENATKETYEDGHTIFKEGDQTRHFYILIKGHVRLSIGRDGHTVFVINHPGECFGWSSLINRSRYSASAVCAAVNPILSREGTLRRWHNCRTHATPSLAVASARPVSRTAVS